MTALSGVALSGAQDSKPILKRGSFWQASQRARGGESGEFPLPVEECSRKVIAIVRFFAFFREKTIKTRQFSLSQPRGCAGWRAAAGSGAGEEKLC
jgi:hypothetical protein